MGTTQQTESRRSTLAQAIRPYTLAALVLAAAVVFQLAFIASFTGAMSRPTLQDATLGLVASPTAGRPAATAVPQVAGVSYRVLPSPAAAAAAAAPPASAAGNGSARVQLRQQAAVPAGASR
jgi:hypothetical protein